MMKKENYDERALADPGGGIPAMAPPTSLKGGPTYLLAPPKTLEKNHKYVVFGMTTPTYAGGSRGHLGPCP